MVEFIRQHAACVLGVIHGFDRLRFRGTLRRIASVRGLGSFLHHAGVLLKEAGAWMQEQTEQVKKASLKRADSQGRPVQYVNDPMARKEEIASRIAARDGIKEGLVCVLTAVEPCCSFDIQRNREKKELELVARWRKCLHLYHYFQHPVFGLMHMRLQTWFPFNLWVNLNGRPVRALNPMGRDDAILLETVSRGEFTINGFRNRDLRHHLYPQPTTDPAERKRQSAAITRKLRLLRSHGLIRKVSRTHRYLLTDRGRQTIATLIAARCADVGTLLKAA